MSVVVVTGAGQSQGAAEARLLAAHGTTVIAADLAEAPAEDLPGADYRQLDVTDQVGWTGLGKELAERYGRVHGLVANAGITWRARLLDVTRWAAPALPVTSRRWSRSCSASRPRSFPAPRSRSTAA